MTSKKPIIISQQLAIFFNKEMDSPFDYVGSLRGKMGNIFDKTKDQIFPNIPEELKLDFKQVEFNSASGDKKLTISKKRSDYFVQPISWDAVDNNLLTSSFIEEVKNFYSFWASVSELKIKRIGFITNYFFESVENSALEKFYSGELKALNEGEAFEIYIHYGAKIAKTIAGQKIELTNLTDIKPVSVALGKDQMFKEGIMLMRDYNTNQDKDYGNVFVEGYSIENAIKQLASEPMSKIGEFEKKLYD